MAARDVRFIPLQPTILTGPAYLVVCAMATVTTDCRSKSTAALADVRACTGMFFVQFGNAPNENILTSTDVPCLIW